MVPGGGLFYTHSLSPDLKLGLAVTGNFGSAVKYGEGWVGRYRAQEGTLLGVSVLPSIATRINENLSLGASLNVMYGKLDNTVAVNNIIGADGKLALEDNTWGVGANLGLLYESIEARASASPTTRRSSSTSARSRSGPTSRPPSGPCLRRAGCSMPGRTSASPCRRG